MTSRELSLYRKHGAAALAAEADRQLAAKLSRSRRLAPRKAPGLKAEATKRATRRDRMAEIAEAVRDRADGRCEICLAEAVLHVHHIVSGSGMRRAHESVFSCIALCELCHHAAHRSDMDTLCGIQFWAELRGDRLAQDAIARRIHKVLEARAALGPTARRDGDRP